MIPLLISLVVPRLPADLEADRARVRAFVEVARYGFDPGVPVLRPPKPGEVPKVDVEDSRPSRTVYDYNSMRVALNTRTGRIEWAVFRPFSSQDAEASSARYGRRDSFAPRRFSDEDAVELAKRYCAKAGWGVAIPRTDLGTVGTETRVVDHYDGERSLWLNLLPSVAGVPYDVNHWQMTVEMDRETGALVDFYGAGDDLPAPPLILAPLGTAAMARDVALRAGAELRGEALAGSKDYPMSLCVWLPRAVGGPASERPGPASRYYGPKVLAALAANRGFLVYKGPLEGGTFDAGVSAVVDARTGEVLDLGPPEGTRPGTAGGAGGMEGAPLPVPTSARPWRLAAGTKGWRVWGAPANAALAPVAGKAPAGRKVTLTDGKAAFPATYDAKANLLGIEGRAYRPGPALARLLRRTPDARKAG